MTNEQFIHKWVHLDVNDTQQMRTKQHENLSFSDDGKTLFSYGWYPIGYRYSESVVFTRIDNYSPSTGRHNSYLSQAISHLIDIPILDKHWGEVHTGYKAFTQHNWHVELANYYAYEIYKANDKKCPDHWANNALISTLNRVVNAFDIKTSGAIKAYCNNETMTLFKLWQELQEVTKQKAEIRVNERRAKQERIQENWRIERAKTHEERLSEWRKGKRRDLYCDQTYLRVKKGILQTSKGMRIELSEAKDVFRKLVYLWKKGSEARKAITIYTTDGTGWCVSFNGFQFVAGCHTIELSEAKQLLS